MYVQLRINCHHKCSWQNTFRWSSCVLCTSVGVIVGYSCTI